MRKLTQKRIIEKHLEDHGDWLPSHKLRAVSTAFGWIGSQGDRRARELAEDGKIERKTIGRYAYYHKARTLKPHYEYDEKRNLMVEVWK